MVPCKQCRASKIKCDHELPCSSCSVRGRQCHYPKGDGSGRQRKYHKRSRNGCLKCKERRVRCDEARPHCGACARMGLQSQCIYIEQRESSAPQQPQHSPQTAHITPPAANAPPVNSAVNTAVNTPSTKTSSPPGNDLEYMLGAMIANTAYQIEAPSMAVPPRQTVGVYTNMIPQASLQELPQVPSTSMVPMDYNYTSQPFEWLVPGTSAETTPLGLTNGYELQSPISLHQPDILALFFPSVEQRRLYRHFLTETVKFLVVIPTPPSSNPWLTRLSSMAIGAPLGHDLYQDALRNAILSLASFDIGFRIHDSLSDKAENAMYKQSWEQRCDALARLKMCVVMDMKPHEADLALGTVVALSFRDRLSGSQEWEEPLQLAANIITSEGGPAAFIAKSPTPIRRYLVEQLTCSEVVSNLSTFALVGMLAWDCSWIEVDPINEPNDHIHIVYGWDRRTVKLAAQTTVLAKEFRKTMSLKIHNARHQYSQVSDTVNERICSINKKALELLEAIPMVRQNLMMMPVPEAVTLMALATLASTELCIRVIIRKDFNPVHVQKCCKTIVEVSDEALVRGKHTGLLLPLTWAAACASGPLSKTAFSLLGLLENRYHLEHDFMSRVVHFPWKELDGVGQEYLDELFKSRGVYVPIF